MVGDLPRGRKDRCRGTRVFAGGECGAVIAFGCGLCGSSGGRRLVRTGEYLSGCARASAVGFFGASVVGLFWGEVGSVCSRQAGGVTVFPVLSSPQQDSPWGRCAGAEVLGGLAAGASRGVCGPGCYAACAMKAGGAALRCGRGVGVIAAEACSRSRASGLRRAFFWAMAMGVGVGWRFQGFLGGGFLGAWA